MKYRIIKEINYDIKNNSNSLSKYLEIREKHLEMCRDYLAKSLDESESMCDKEDNRKEWFYDRD